MSPLLFVDLTLGEMLASYALLCKPTAGVKPASPYTASTNEILAYAALLAGCKLMVKMTMYIQNQHLSFSLQAF